MRFKLGNRVTVVDDDITGIVVEIANDIITIETADGFNLQFEFNELIHDQSLSKDVFSGAALSEVIEQKEFSDKKKVTQNVSKERQHTTLEIDLHIHKLIDSEKGMSSFDKLNLQIETAKRQLDFAIRKHIKKIVFIHGVGEGVLKMELETLFRRYDNIQYYDADLQKYGYGATEVQIYQNGKFN